jgi:hypothetical protein
MFKKADEATLASIYPGQVVFVEGTVKGKTFDVLLDNCRILE